MRSYIVIAAAAAAIACGKGASPTAPTPVAPAAVDLKAALSNAFDTLVIPQSSWCSISISQHGDVLLERGRGPDGPGKIADADTLYRIASLTKPITASAMLISEKAGRMGLADKINRYLPFPEPAPTIDELIKHVPGLSDYLATSSYQSGRTSATTVDHLLSLIQPWDGVRRYQYSNSHAVLSGATLQKVNGMRYEDVLQRDIFGPAGMSRTSFALPPSTDLFPFGPTHSSWVYAAGGVTSTAADMNRFNQALMNNLFGFGALDSFLDSTAGVTSFGMGSGVSNGDRRYTHAGGFDNYSSFSMMFPADRSSIVVLCSFNNNNPGTLGNLLAGMRNIMLAAK